MIHKLMFVNPIIKSIYYGTVKIKSRNYPGLFSALSLSHFFKSSRIHTGFPPGHLNTGILCFFAYIFSVFTLRPQNALISSQPVSNPSVMTISPFSKAYLPQLQNSRRNQYNCLDKVSDPASAQS